MSSIPPDEKTAIVEIIHQLRSVAQLLEVWLTIRTIVVPPIDAEHQTLLFEPTPHRDTDDTVS